mgnify:CR=1 FL=1
MNTQFSIKREKFNGQLLAIGRLVPYKGFEFLIKAINKSNYQLHIIGDGPLYDSLKVIAGKNIFLHRKVDETMKNQLFHQCDLLIVPSINRAEAYGMTIAEAFETGMPVVASNLETGVTWLVQDEKTGLVFDTLNAESLLRAIKKFEDDEIFYQNVSLNTKQFFEENLKYEHFKNKFKNI